MELLRKLLFKLHVPWVCSTVQVLCVCLFAHTLLFSIVVLTCGLQVLFIEVGGRALNVVSLEYAPWLISIAFGVGMLIWGTLQRVLIPPPEWRWLKYQQFKQDNVELP
jgi:hypothetical protein